MGKTTAEARKLMISAGGWIASLVALLAELAEEAGMTLEDVHRLATPQGKEVLRRMVQAMIAVMHEAWGMVRYAIAVNYRLSLDEMIAAVNCDWVNENIAKSKEFRQEIEIAAAVKRVQQEDLSAVLLHLKHEATSQEVLKEMEKRGLRAATLAELCAFGAKHPEFQREFPIIGLGSYCVLGGGRQVPVLWGFASGRSLYLYYPDFRWRAYCRFLAVSK
ncbi:MAG: Uncharacterized protein CEN92_8 [Candidatus Berkelbacteria bacterium Licking1014_96]|uniref:Uncharacterized protein n=1 Tax=Candidatus Berkelbacteria bacterium Licking1014_96 TaxID=2017149 RepID=A0A554LHL9_9BACT|nr:MAG: Uncharacterized protein CEN92_8 [Candidatus Berkelbacteria bacterium Licking1014_96]